MSTDAPARGDMVELEVRGISSQGAGIADLADGRVVFVPRAAPGDRIRARLGKVKARWAEATLEEVLDHGSERVDPKCGVYDECGGCSLQHVDYEAQLRWKGRFVADALQRIGGIEAEAPSVVASPKQVEYRNRITYTLRRLRGGRVVAGFHALGRPAHVVEVQNACVLPEPELREAWEALRTGWGAGTRRLPGGGRLRLTLRSGDEGVTLLVEGGEPGWTGGGLAQVVPTLRAIWHRPQKDRPVALVWGEPTSEQWGEEKVPVTGRAFLQVNREAAALLEAHVEDQVGTPDTAVDAYAGVGRYARALARGGATVTAIELDRDAAATAEGDAPSGLTVQRGDVADLLGAALPTELLVLNPPRTGIGSAVAEAIRSSPPPRIVYVSCDPATLARDLAELRDLYVVVDVAAFDLFPQTAHVETVVTLRRAAEDA